VAGRARKSLPDRRRPTLGGGRASSLALHRTTSPAVRPDDASMVERGTSMLINESHARALAAQRQQEAIDHARRSRINAARRSKRQAEASSRWIRRLLLAVR
jgi:hypothetical protein